MSNIPKQFDILSVMAVGEALKESAFSEEQKIKEEEQKIKKEKDMQMCIQHSLNQTMIGCILQPLILFKVLQKN